MLTVGISMLYISISYAQSSSAFMGARAVGLAYASSSLQDEWAIFNNPAGLANVKESVVAFTYDAMPSFKPFNRMAVAFSTPLKMGAVAAGVFRFGDDLYNEQLVCGAYSNTLGLASLGIKLNYVQYNAQGFGSKQVFSVSFGGIAKLTESISIGAHIININQPEISTAEKEKLPTILVVGASAQLSTQTFVTSELEKDLAHAVRWKTGVEYKPFKKFTFRTGYAVNPSAAYIGFGFRSRQFQLDYGYQHHFSTGARHQATVAYQLKKQK